MTYTVDQIVQEIEKAVVRRPLLRKDPEYLINFVVPNVYNGKDVVPLELYRAAEKKWRENEDGKK